MEGGKREALIFVPGLGGGAESAGSIATRIADELRRLSGKGGTVSVSQESEVRYGTTLAAKMATIAPVAEDGKPDIPAIDVYFFDYRDMLTKNEKSWNSVAKGWFLVLTFITGVWTFVSALNPLKSRKGISRKDGFQICYGLFTLLVILAGSILTFYGVSTALAGALGSKAVNTAGWGYLTKDAVTVLGVLGLSSSALGAAVASVAEKVVAMMHYLSVGNRKGAMTGPLEDLIKHVAHGPYDERRIVAYSFGSIVTLDTLFPKGEERTGRHFSTIATLVTIGCPFDVVRYYHPTYFDDRHPTISPATRWINIYSPADVLGSNFRNDAKELEPEVPIGVKGSARKPENLSYTDALGADKFSWLTALLFMGLRAHAMYWERSPCSEVSSFRLMLETLSRKGPLPTPEK